MPTPMMAKKFPTARLGNFKLHGNSAFWSTGPGGKVDITFTIEGTTTVDGQSFTVPKTTGYISVSSSNWCKWARPDYSKVTYSVDGTAPSNILGCVDKDKKLFGLNATTHSDAINDVLGYMIRGIFAAHGELTGWATKKIKKNP
ncbi:hypothetical protein QBC40DRAFT_321973 [Triangularia verruculosa]|uniref:Uncharacterized protein n=1 Tax=Triangularia verruculosa TaxID=2587418 RepID=A0AAN6XKN6_9PEZI|nr:hypothetical protein QBC40DRAFT_321973 [Triangularia verruculosa]